MSRPIKPFGLSVLVGIGVLAGLIGAGQRLTEKGFENLATLDDAVQVVKKSLKQEGKSEYAELVQLDRVRKAIHIGITSYEAVLKNKKLPAGDAEYFEKTVKPVLLRIADKGAWPAGCSFFTFYTLTEERTGIAYDGYWVRLQVATPNAKRPAFALPVLDLCFGKVSD